MEKPKKKLSVGKKILFGVGVLFVIGLIVGPDKDNSDDKVKVASTNTSSSDNATSNSPVSDKPDYKKIGDQIEVGNFSYRVNSAKFAKTVGSDFAQKTADGIFLIVNVSFRNNDSEEHTLDNSFFKLTDENGTEFESSTDGEAALEMSGQETLFLKQCNPQITKSGLLIFEVPGKKVYDLHLSGGFWSGKTAVVKLTTK